MTWPFPTHPLKPWTKQQEKEYQEQHGLAELSQVKWQLKG